MDVFPSFCIHMTMQQVYFPCFRIYNTIAVPALKKFSLVCYPSRRMASTISETAAPWHAAYPTPSDRQPGSITRDAVLELMKNESSIAGKDFVLVDLRRVDHEVSYGTEAYKYFGIISQKTPCNFREAQFGVP